MILNSGGITKLTNGLVLRKKSGNNYTNYWNAKSNGDLRVICATDMLYSDKAGGGENGASFRYTLGGKDKHDTVIELLPGESLEAVVSDALQGLTRFRMMAQGFWTVA